MINVADRSNAAASVFIVCLFCPLWVIRVITVVGQNNLCLLHSISDRFWQRFETSLSDNRDHSTLNIKQKERPPSGGLLGF
jgi:hypothetical protein